MTSNSLVSRLLDADTHSVQRTLGSRIFLEAAVEIERLQREFSAVKSAALDAAASIEELISERDRLRAALERWEKNCTGMHGSQVQCGDDTSACPADETTPKQSHLACWCPVCGEPHRVTHATGTCKTHGENIDPMCRECFSEKTSV